MFDCYLNGEILPFDQCRLHISDLQVQRGYGVFDFFRCRGDRIPFLEDYTSRLFNSIERSGLDCQLNSQELLAVIDELLQRNCGEHTAFKVLVTGGYSLDLATISGNANVIILHLPWEAPDPKLARDGVNLISDEYIRPEPEIKTLHYFNSARLQKKMKSHRAVDVLYHTDVITETSRANVFAVKSGEVFTAGDNILQGITRKQVLGMFKEVRLKNLPFDELFEADEIFLSSTGLEITPVVTVDGKRIGNGTPGRITREVQDAFLQLLG